MKLKKKVVCDKCGESYPDGWPHLCTEVREIVMDSHAELKRLREVAKWAREASDLMDRVWESAPMGTPIRNALKKALRELDAE